MGILKNLFKNNEDTLSIINTKKVTDEINAKAFEVSIGYTNETIELNGVKLITKTGYHNENNNIETIHYIGILSEDDNVFFFNIDKPLTIYSVGTEKYDTFFPTSFWMNRYFLEHANGIFNEVKTIQEKHKENCLNILEQVKDL